ncbi:hypothetical protein GTP45_14365 [Pseudoduganella sp. FT55W]|uniref:Uncharacterized protein n=1 Tax=Duganella rivi TaxID=2666083 RepID=A0A7X4KCA9_9BURK|nr:hypothetical protein [Duganella rivi]MYM68005.1 hypothetical protein [Duganella rivi]
MKTFILALALPGIVAAQGSAAVDESFVRGRAAYSPAMTQSLLKKVEAYCASADKSARDNLTAAVAAWQKRHADLLLENIRVRGELLDEVNALTAPQGLKAELDNMLNKQVPSQVEADYKKLIPPDTSKGWATKAFVCGANAGMIEQGQFDLDRLDPQVADYLRRRIAPPGSSGVATP